MTQVKVARRDVSHSLVAPETLSQARNWDKRKNNFVDRGCCHACAAQAAWGHSTSVGFARINPPCATCRPIVASFPLSTTNPLWRTLPQSLRQAPASPLKTDLMGTMGVPGVGATPSPSVTAGLAA